MSLTSKEISTYRSNAHHLKPVVSIGQHGLTAAVVREIDIALKAHELIKVKMSTDDRAERDNWVNLICEDLEAHHIQTIGKILVLYRKNPEE